MLHQQDQNLLMLHPDKNKSILRMDLNRSDVVEEWVFILVRIMFTFL